MFKVYLLHIQNDRKRKETFKEVYLRYDLLWRRFECRVILRAIQYDTDKVTRAQTYCYTHIYTGDLLFIASSRRQSRKSRKTERKKRKNGQCEYAREGMESWSCPNLKEDQERQETEGH